MKYYQSALSVLSATALFLASSTLAAPTGPSVSSAIVARNLTAGVSYNGTSLNSTALNGTSSGNLSSPDASDFIRGVNIGGWLILEEWMNSDVFSGSSASDQYTFDSQSGASSKLQAHWDSYFTESDVQSLKSYGINALRIPIGFWAYDNADLPYVQGADAYLEKAVGWAKNAGMKVWVDCHGSPGSQNGYDNSGHAGDVAWQQDNNLNRSISVLKTMAKKYGAEEYAGTVVGLEIANEPISWGNNNFGKIQEFATDAYNAVKAEAANPDLMVVMHDAFQGPSAWTDVASKLNANGKFGIDTHLYQVFEPADLLLNQEQHIQKACGWASDFEANSAMPTFAGEWSAATEICVNPDGSTTAGTVCLIPGCQCQSADMDSWNDNMIKQVRMFVEAQMDVFENSGSGYFMWSFKGPGSWNFMDGIEKGFIPNPVTSRQYPGQCSGSSKRSLSGEGRRVARGQLGASGL